MHIALVYSGNTLTGYANGARTGGGEIKAATDNGLDSCWLNRLDPEELAAGLGLPENEEVLMAMENKPQLQTKYISANLTLQNWLRIRKHDNDKQ